MATHDHNADNSTLRRLVAGFEQFRTAHFSTDADLFDSLLEGQRPDVMVIACSDSSLA